MYQKFFLNLLILPVFLNTDLLAQEKILSDVKRSDIFKKEQKKNDSPIISKSKLPPSNGSLSTPVKLSDFRPSSCSKQEPLKELSSLPGSSAGKNTSSLSSTRAQSTGYDIGKSKALHQEHVVGKVGFDPSPSSLNDSESLSGDRVFAF